MKIIPTILNSSSFGSKLQVDSVHVMDKVVVSGSRDRGISVWSIDQVLFFSSNDDDVMMMIDQVCNCTSSRPSSQYLFFATTFLGFGRWRG